MAYNVHYKAKFGPKNARKFYAAKSGSGGSTINGKDIGANRILKFKTRTQAQNYARQLHSFETKVVSAKSPRQTRANLRPRKRDNNLFTIFR